MPTTSPNFVFILSDQHRWDFMGYEAGNGQTLTPCLDALATSGAVFRRAYTVAPLCCPARQALMSGRYPSATGCHGNLQQLPPGIPTFVNQLRAAGYHTAAIGKTHLEIHAYDSDLLSPAHTEYMRSLGWEETCEISGQGMLKTGIRCAQSAWLQKQGLLDDAVRHYRKWHYFMDKELNGDDALAVHPWPLIEKASETGFVTREACEWLGHADASRPFLLHVGYGAPHEPLEPLSRILGQYENLSEGSTRGAPVDERVRQARRAYRALITQIDEGVGCIRETLAKRGLLENTVIIFTADHGNEAGDRGRWGQCSFYDGAVRVPLVIAGPRIPHLDNSALVETLDLGITICDIAGVDAHALDQGMSLKPILLRERITHRDTVLSELGCDRMIFDGKYKLMLGDPRSDQRNLGTLHLDRPVGVPPSPGRLYNLGVDPEEKNDLMQSEPATLNRLQALLLERLTKNLPVGRHQDRGHYDPVQAMKV